MGYTLEVDFREGINTFGAVLVKNKTNHLHQHQQKQLGARGAMALIQNQKRWFGDKGSFELWSWT